MNSHEGEPVGGHQHHERPGTESSTAASSNYDTHQEKPARDNGHPHASIGEEDTRELHRIATALSRHRSRVSRTGTSPAIAPSLDPASDQFDTSLWVQDFVSQLRDKGHESNRLGVSFKDLDVFGSGAALQLQETVDSVLSAPLRIGELLSPAKKPRRHILRGFNGLLKSGELLAVLGRPGSGCSTFLKTICGELYGLDVGQDSKILYNGISQRRIKKEFKGEVIYNQEVDKHFPHLTVGQTLEFAASCRTPSARIQDMSRSEYCQYMARVVMAIFGLSHTYNTKVGNDYIRGVSGGERKRVSIAEMMVAGSPICAWDNSTRGLDSSSSLKFVQALRASSDMMHQAHAVAMYQASQAIYDTFDKVTVLYAGRQVYFGPANQAKAYFERQGWFCPPRQTTGDFLTAVTNPDERIPRMGFENKVPRTPDDFERYWKESPEFDALIREIDDYDKEFDGNRSKEVIANLREHKKYRQAKHVRPKSPYTISIPMQIRLLTVRSYQRIWNDLAATLSHVASNLVIAFIIGSIFYGNPDATAGFAGKGSVLFMAILLNALTAIAEIDGLYAQRPIVEKHHSYSFYHPAAEAASGIVADIPVKFVTATVFNLVVYFLAGLRRTPDQFFLYFLISYISTFVMSAVFRTLAAITKTVSQAMALAGVLVLALVNFTGFTQPPPQMHPWFGWIRWINPIFYAFEILVANEFHGRDFTCSNIVPPYSPPIGDSWVCASVGSVPGQYTVSGDAYIQANYEYSYSHVWRNFGILIAFLVFFMGVYFLAVELNSSVASTAEALVYQRGKVPASLLNATKDVGCDNGDMTTEVVHEKEEPRATAIEPQKDVFTWKDVVYDIEIKGEQRRLLDHVSGWVKPGTLTALMGSSGAGKTTLLDVLAQRTTMGVITGDMLVNGKPFGPEFQRNCGYVQQQDLHLDTATVRESLRFSAMLRRPQSVSKEEKFAFVEEVIKMLGMEEYADAVVGIAGEGLNVEQRKLLTIGVELVAKPKLLLFLDEPTSGLDSQSAWSICVFLRKLADAGQAVLCTIHQPNALLFQQFDRLLFLQKGGKTVYFGDIGKNSQTLLNYFETNGGRRCGDDENPAEYMLEIVAEGTNSSGEDWHSVWKSSPEFQSTLAELSQLNSSLPSKPSDDSDPSSTGSHTEFAMPLSSQIREVTVRIFQQYWRMPSYIFAKLILGIASGLFIGFTFWKPSNTQAGTRDILYSVFMLTTIFTTLVQQIQPLFIVQRSLYEVRERPSKAYSWKAFIIANIIVEMPYQILTGILTYACFYYPVVGVQASQRQGLVLLFVIQLFIYASSFAHLTITALPNAQAAAGLVVLFTMMSTIFSGVLQTKAALPGFWTFMYRVSPFTYWIGGIAATLVHDRVMGCSDAEMLVFNPPLGQTCGQYLAPLAGKSPGTLENPASFEACRFCASSVADEFLEGVDIYWGERWRNFGIVWAYVGFNIVVAIGAYYVFRVKRWDFKGFGRKKN